MFGGVRKTAIGALLVHVTNPGGLGGGADIADFDGVNGNGSDKGKAKTKTKGKGKFGGKLLKGLGKGLGAVGGGLKFVAKGASLSSLASLAVPVVAESVGIEKDSKPMNYLDRILTGAAIGGTVGTIIPGVGNLVGTLVGAGGGLLTAIAEDYFSSKKETEELKLKEIKVENPTQPQQMNIKVDVINEKLTINDNEIPLKKGEYNAKASFSGGF